MTEEHQLLYLRLALLKNHFLFPGGTVLLEWGWVYKNQKEPTSPFYVKDGDKYRIINEWIKPAQTIGNLAWVGSINETLDLKKYRDDDYLKSSIRNLQNTRTRYVKERTDLETAITKIETDRVMKRISAKQTKDIKANIKNELDAVNKQIDEAAPHNKIPIFEIIPTPIGYPQV